MIQNQISCEAKNYNKQTKKSSLWLTWARQKNKIKELNHHSSSPGLGSTFIGVLIMVLNKTISYQQYKKCIQR